MRFTYPSTMPLSTAGIRHGLLILLLLIVTGCSLEGTVPAGTEPRGETIDPSQTVLVIGDWGAGTTEQEAVAEAMSDVARSNDVGAIVTTGDNFYSDDAESLMEPFAWAMERNIPFVITWGNHDIDNADRITAIDETFDDPPRWTTHRWGNALVVVLDSTQPHSEDQVDFLLETLAGSDLPTIVVIHHPPFSCGSHGDDRALQEDLLSHLDDDVFLVLSGHEHNYQRFEESGVTYVVTGGGGAALTDLGSCPPGHPSLAAAESVHHFVALEQGDGVALSVIDVDGGPIDEFEVPLP